MNSKEWTPDTIAFDVPGWLTLSPSLKSTRTGVHYWELRSSAGTRSFFAIWSSEILRLLDDLSHLLTMNLDKLDWPEGFSPLAWHPGSTGGPIIGIYRNHRSTALSIRRLSSTFTNSDGARGHSGLFRWQMWGRDRKVLSQCSIELANFLHEDAKAAIDEVRGQVRASLEAIADASFPELQSLADCCNHILVSGQVRTGATNTLRHMTLDCGLPTLEGFEVRHFAGGVTRAALERCTEPRTREEIADLMARDVDDLALSEHVGIYTRYAARTIQLGYWVSPQTEARTYAILDKAAFLSDPLLTSLARTEPTTSKARKEDWITCPQYPRQDPPPFDRALEKRPDWFAGIAQSTVGSYPIPPDTRGDTIRKLAAPSTTLKQKRWQVLQLLQAHGAILNNRQSLYNSDSRDREYTVTAIQRIALLLNDVDTFFPEETRTEILSLVTESRQGYLKAIEGSSKPQPLRSPSTLPQARDFQ